MYPSDHPDASNSLNIRVRNTVEAPDRGQLQRILFARQHFIALLCQNRRLKTTFNEMRREPEHNRRISHCTEQLKAGHSWEQALAGIMEPNPRLGGIISRTVRDLFCRDSTWVSEHLIQRFLASECRRMRFNATEHPYSAIPNPSNQPLMPEPDYRDMTLREARRAKSRWQRETNQKVASNRIRGRVPKKSGVVIRNVEWYVRQQLQGEMCSALAKDYHATAHPNLEPDYFFHDLPLINKGITAAATWLALPRRLRSSPHSK